MINKYQIGIDIGKSKIESVLFNPTGSLIFKKRIPTPKNSKNQYKEICVAIHSLVKATRTNGPLKMDHTLGIGVPGRMDKKSNKISNASIKGLVGKPFKKDLEDLFGHKIGMANDAACFTLAESLSGAAKGHQRMVFGIILGTGCGGGICIDGKIFEGRNGVAGEWGHFPIDPSGEKCFCGFVGCLETKISGSGVERLFLRKFQESFTMKQIVQGYKEKDPRCTKIMEKFLENFSRYIGGVISLLDPDAIVVGGGLSNIDELFTFGAERVKEYTYHRQIDTPILKNKLGDSAGVYGAAWIGEY